MALICQSRMISRGREILDHLSLACTPLGGKLYIPADTMLINIYILCIVSLIISTKIQNLAEIVDLHEALNFRVHSRPIRFTEVNA